MPTKRFVIPVLLIAVGLTGAFISYLIFADTTPASELSYERTVQETPKEEKMSLAQATLLESEYLGLQPDAVEGDLTITESAETAVLKAYGIKVAEIMTIFSSATKESEPGIMFQALEKKDKKKALVEIEKIKKLAEIYKRTAINLGVLTVPQGVAPIHLAIGNALTHLEVHVRNMGNVLEDPVKAITSADGYVKESRLLFQALSDLNAFFTANNITFSEEEQANVTLHEI